MHISWQHVNAGTDQDNSVHASTPSRYVLLSLATNGLQVGFPGSENSGCTPCAATPFGQAHRCLLRTIDQ